MHKKHIRSLENKQILKNGQNYFLTKIKKMPDRSFNIDAKLTTKKSIASGFCSFFSKIAGALKEKSISFTNSIWSTPDKAKMKIKLAFKLILVTFSEVFVKLKMYSERCCYHNRKALGTGHQSFHCNSDLTVWL